MRQNVSVAKVTTIPDLHGMSNTPSPAPPDPALPDPAPPDRSSRASRLREALRENLKRRKAQARGRAGADAEPRPGRAGADEPASSAGGAAPSLT
jgi:hypothetical protein